MTSPVVVEDRPKSEAESAYINSPSEFEILSDSESPHPLTSTALLYWEGGGLLPSDLPTLATIKTIPPRRRSLFLSTLKHLRTHPPSDPENLCVAFHTSTQFN